MGTGVGAAQVVVVVVDLVDTPRTALGLFGVVPGLTGSVYALLFAAIK